MGWIERDLREEFEERQKEHKVTNAPRPQQSSTPPLDARALFMKYIRTSYRHMQRANAIQKRYVDQVGTLYPTNGQALIACSSDYYWRVAVQDQQFAERLANMYGTAVLVAGMDRLIAALEDKKK